MHNLLSNQKTSNAMVFAFFAGLFAVILHG